jgi:23S rRNA pseudouridine1911/1915/1917 synthase
MVYSCPYPGKGDKAVTHNGTIKTNGRYSLLAIEPETGRKKHIRVHMKDLGHSVAGDEKCGSAVNPVGRMFLQAQVPAFVHPVIRETMHLKKGIPKSFQHCYDL